MNRSAQFAPSWMPRQARRRIDRELRELIRRDVCSVCRRPFRHNSRTASGLDAHGNVALAGECCSSHLAEIFTLGLYSDRRYDFLSPDPAAKTSASPPDANADQIANAITAYQQAIAATDKQIDGIEKRGGLTSRGAVNLRDTAWKHDDRAWFERNPKRAHRARMPFPGEVGNEVAKAPAGYALVMLLRQVEPGSRLRAAFYLNAELLPVPDDEAVAHALFEVATQHEAIPLDGPALGNLIRKYMAEPAQQRGCP